MDPKTFQSHRLVCPINSSASFSFSSLFFLKKMFFNLMCSVLLAFTRGQTFSHEGESEHIATNMQYVIQ